MREFPEPEQASTRKIGTAMTLAAWLVVLVLATWYLDGFLDREHNPNEKVITTEENGTREITLQRNRQGHYVSSGKINDVAVRFMLDTGATDVSIPQKIAARLQLKPGPAHDVITANGRIRVFATILSRIQIGDIVLQDVRASINPYMDEEEILLGMSFLKHLEFTQRGDQLILRQYSW